MVPEAIHDLTIHEIKSNNESCLQLLNSKIQINNRILIDKVFSLFYSLINSNRSNNKNNNNKKRIFYKYLICDINN